jgi:hypothetical protein
LPFNAEEPTNGINADRTSSPKYGHFSCNKGRSSSAKESPCATGSYPVNMSGSVSIGSSGPTPDYSEPNVFPKPTPDYSET